MKPESHEDVTNCALKLFRRDNSSKLCNALRKPRFKKALIKGTRDEDNPTLTRGLNWHFYGANEVIKKYEHVLLKFPKVVIRPTSESILMRREQQLNSAIKDGATQNLFVLLGRILHHVQDMSTPSHVVPVYHGPGVEDKYENFLEEQWGKLDRRITNNWSVADIDTSYSENFLSIYCKAAKRILLYLKSSDATFTVSVNDTVNSVKISEIWKEYSRGNDGAQSNNVPLDIPGFGTFGVVGKNFGELSFSEEEESFQLTEETYLNIAEKFTADAVTDSVQALYAFEVVVDKAFANRGFIESANPFLEYEE